ncbi:hypothetical protein CERSUDRAFT_101309 [Gelatoporia subvermispora B]|uniref:Uncharacterized protein n=1 Tax=Ceriporiopsis subvermispora (strain B) TaxID=914234 RepID=M2QVF1_CERS8|nr:hypothetical protein CERSUDRAFT_101309 [Gelatoporia subvermispora B]
MGCCLKGRGDGVPFSSSLRRLSVSPAAPLLSFLASPYTTLLLSISPPPLVRPQARCAPCVCACLSICRPSRCCVRDPPVHPDQACPIALRLPRARRDAPPLLCPLSPRCVFQSSVRRPYRPRPPFYARPARTFISASPVRACITTRTTDRAAPS